MSRKQYKSYLSDPFLDVNRKGIPRQTRHNIKKRMKLDTETVTPPLNEIQEFPIEPEEHQVSSLIEEDFAMSDCELSSDESEIDCSDSRSDSSDMDSIEREYDVNDEDPYINANLRCREGCFLVLVYVLKHKISRQGIQDLLDLLKFLLPPSVQFPGTHYLLKKKLQINYKRQQYHFYCSTCKAFLENAEACSPCLQKGQNPEKNFFLTFDIKRSFQELLDIEEVSKDLSKNLEIREGRKNEENCFMEYCFDGKMYKNLNLKAQDLTATGNSDGVPCFNSSKFAVWPFLISLNELSYKLRRKYTLIGALWFGKEKPIFPTFLRPIVAELNELSHNPLTWKNGEKSYCSRIYLPLVAADSVARCSLQGLKQFNGSYGCPYCLEKGETHWLSDNAHKWVYKSHQAPLRSQHGFLADLAALREKLQQGSNCKSFHGIKEASALLLLSKFDIVKGFSFDYMHTAELGVSRTFTNAWLNSKNHDQPFYIGDKIQEINTALLKWRMPHVSERAIRGLDERKYWKSSEWRTWTFLTPVILKNVLPNQYWNHFVKFAKGLFLLCSRKVYAMDITEAKTLLYDFVTSVEDLYGDSFCSFNLHLLTHAAECADNWGPLWNYSLFHFENFNGVLLSYFRASYRIEAQISKRIIENSHAFASGGLVFKNKFALSFYDSLVSNRRLLLNCKKVSEFCLLFGSSKHYFLNEDEMKLIRELAHLEEILSCESFKRGYINEIHLSTHSRTTKKRCKSVVKIASRLFLIKRIIVVTFLGDLKRCFLICYKLKLTQLIHGYPAFKVKTENRIKIIVASIIDDLTSFCSVNNTDEIQQIVHLPNTVECE